ncbi:MAG: YkgJ family cysteine cluster protein [Clostridia bacterium]|nr:YkgJ family cysteine cluster protein [Clostridia bacterium]
MQSQPHGEPLERVIIATGKEHRCILNNKENSRCEIHQVKPMQCVTFPLIPIDLENDIFYEQDSCTCKEKKEMRVLDWLNGKDGIYLKYKKIYIEWINFVEEMQSKWKFIDKRVQNKIVNMVFYNYDDNIKDIKKSVRKNMKQARALAHYRKE